MHGDKVVACSWRLVGMVVVDESLSSEVDDATREAYPCARLSDSPLVLVFEEK
jgi:hypothetical protein